MAPRSCKPEAVPPKPQKFYKVIFDPEDHKLKIPAEFIRRHGYDFLDIVFLKVPTGSSWKVQLSRSENEVWLGKGWPEFKEHYSIEYGYFLVFEYQGNAQFNVVICDITALEIEYPLVNGAPREEPNMVDISSESDDSDVKSLKELSPKEEGEKYSVKRSKKVVSATVDRQTCRAYQRAKSFKSGKPFCISVVQPCSAFGASLFIPVSIAEENLPDKCNSLMLRVPGGKKKWPVKCTIYARNAKLNCGWRKFVEENKLEVGDACVFEVVKRKEPVWNVTIFRS